MIETKIAPDDLAIVRPQAIRENCDIVVAMPDGDATPKRNFSLANGICLQPENPRLETIILNLGDGEVGFLGKVTGIDRSLE